MADMIKDAYVTIDVRDMAKAVRFYTKTLGLKLVKNYKGYWADIKAPGIWIGLHLDHEKRLKGKKGSGNVSIGLDVLDMDKAVARLKKKSVRFKSYEMEWGRFAEFQDPDGTDLYFRQEA